MTNVLIINGHLKYDYSQGKLNAAFAERAQAFFQKAGSDVKTTVVDEGYEVADEIAKLKWADIVFLQMPINWMGTPWLFKKYVDEVWNAGLFGDLSNGDGRSSAAPKTNYGLGGTLSGCYMLSLTGNVPREAFNNPEETFFDGMSEDDLLRPMHLNFKWIGLTPLPTFMSYDVMKNPEVESDFRRFDEHLAETFSSLIQTDRAERPRAAV